MEFMEALENLLKLHNFWRNGVSFASGEASLIQKEYKRLSRIVGHKRTREETENLTEYAKELLYLAKPENYIHKIEDLEIKFPKRLEGLDLKSKDVKEIAIMIYSHIKTSVDRHEVNSKIITKKVDMNYLNSILLKKDEIESIPRKFIELIEEITYRFDHEYCNELIDQKEKEEKFIKSCL